MKAYTKLKALLGDVRAQHTNLIQEREKLLQRREDLHSLPLPKKDFIAYMGRIIDGGRKEYVERLGHEIQNVFHRHDVTRLPGTFPLLAPHSGQGAQHINVLAVLALFGPQLKESLAGIVQDLEWPNEVGPTLAERSAAIEDVDSKIGKLEDELSELNSLARSSGVELTGMAVPKKGDKALPGQKRTGFPNVGL